MQPQWGRRISWTDLPEHVRAGIEQVLGAPVEQATGQRGGFSPGTADRVRTTTGRRAFVKAVGPAPNDASPAIHRKEAAITAVLPRTTARGVADRDVRRRRLDGAHPHRC